MKRILFILSGIIIAVSAVQTASAQVSGFAIGPKAGIYLDKGKLMIGAIAEIPFAQNLWFEPGIEVIPSSATNTMRLIGDANGRYSFQIRGETIEPFLIGGLGFVLDIQTINSQTYTQTDIRLNVGGGITFNTRGLIQPWGGLKLFFISKESTDFVLQGGVNFYL